MTKPAPPTALFVWFVALAAVGLVSTALPDGSETPVSHHRVPLELPAPSSTTAVSAAVATTPTTSTTARVARTTHLPSTPAGGALFARITPTGVPVLNVSRFDGSGFRALAQGDDTHTVTSFLWSPDRTRLLVVEGLSGSSFRLRGNERPDRYQVFDVAKGTLSPIATADSGQEFDVPKWSPDSSRVAFFVGPQGPGAEGSVTSVRVVDVATAEGRDVAPVDMHLAYGLAWSPDGKAIAYSPEGDNTQAQTLWVVPAAGGKPVRAATNVRTFRWSPDGRRFAYSTNDNPPYVDVPFHIVDRDGTNDEPVLQPASASQSLAWRPEWSPDGSRILVDLDDTTSQPADVGIVDLASRAWTKFAGTTELCWRNEWPSCWTKDASHVFLLAFASGDVRLGDTGGGSRPLTGANTERTELSPDGRTLAWSNASGEIALTDLASGRQTRLSGGMDLHVLEWAPDGSVVVARDASTGDYVTFTADGRAKSRFHD